jgi:hypothetical protein
MLSYPVVSSGNNTAGSPQNYLCQPLEIIELNHGICRELSPTGDSGFKLAQVVRNTAQRFARHTDRETDTWRSIMVSWRKIHIWDKKGGEK